MVQPVMRLIEAINDAISILDTGSNYERAHVASILRGGKNAFYAQQESENLLNIDIDNE